MPHFIVLDYFWLQRNYYKARYGTNWLSDKLALLLQQPSWIAMILPVGVGPDGHALRMLSNFESPTLSGNVKVERISAQENPLVKVTLNANRKLRSRINRVVSEFMSIKCASWRLTSRPSSCRGIPATGVRSFDCTKSVSEGYSGGGYEIEGARAHFSSSRPMRPTRRAFVV